MYLNQIPELANFADDYARLGIETAEDLILLTAEEIADLGIGGIAAARASKHLIACSNALPPKEESVSEPIAETVSVEPKPAKAPKMANPIENHPALAHLNPKDADRVLKFASLCDRVEDPQKWLDSVYRRAVLFGDPVGQMQRFAKNLIIRLV